MKWIILAVVILYVYWNLTLNVETTDANVNQALGLPLQFKAKDFLNPTATGTQKLIHVRISI